MKKLPLWQVGSESSSGTMPAEKTDENFNDQQQGTVNKRI